MYKPIYFRAMGNARFTRMVSHHQLLILLLLLWSFFNGAITSHLCDHLTYHHVLHLQTSLRGGSFVVSEELQLEHNTHDLEETLANMSSGLAEVAIKLVQEGASKCSTPRSSVFSGANSINSAGNKFNIQASSDEVLHPVGLIIMLIMLHSFESAHDTAT
jgi:hypothetical protein